MPERWLEAMTLRKLAHAALAFQDWLEDDSASTAIDEQAREARRQLRALSRSRLPSEPTLIYDSVGRVIGTIDPATPADYSLCLGDDGDLIVASGTDLFVFVLDEQGILHFIRRRPSAEGVLDGDRPT
jgi:hypothetical protein